MTKLGNKIFETLCTMEEYSKYQISVGKICRFCKHAEPLSVTGSPYGRYIWCINKCIMLENYCTCEGYDTDRYEEVIE